MTSETVRGSSAPATGPLPSPGSPSPSIDELEAMWATLELLREDPASAPWSPRLLPDILELASVELYRRLVAAHTAARGGAKR